jgi:hypothetical protein
MADQIQQNKTDGLSSSEDRKQSITFFKDAPTYNDINMPADPSPETEITDGSTNPEPASNMTPKPASNVMQTPMKKMMSTIDNTVQQLELTDAEQIENTVNRYVKLLDPADKYYIKYQHVYDNGEKYIAYLKSPEYVQYKKERKALESKYSSNKRYTVEVTKKKVIVYKKDSEGNTDKAAKLDELERPTYINLNEIFEKTHRNISQTRLKLKAQYNQFVARPYIESDIKNKFIKQREAMITKLNDFYSIQYFYNKVNGIIQSEKIVALPIKMPYYSENKQEVVHRLLSKDISIAAEDLQLLYNNGAAKLELYNKIQELIVSTPDKKKEINELIKMYINFDEEHQRELLYKIEKKKSHQLINYMVIPAGLEMPTDNSIIRPRDMRPFFAMHKKASSS